VRLVLRQITVTQLIKTLLSDFVSVGYLNRYSDWLRAGRSGDRIPVGARFSARLDRSWGPPSLLYNGYRVCSGGKYRPGRAADHSPPSRAEILEDKSYTSTSLWAKTGPVTVLLYFILSDFVVPKVLLTFSLNPATGTIPQPAAYYLPFHAVFVCDIPYA